MKSPLLLPVGLLLSCLAPMLCAEITLAPLFGDHAVLQRDKPVPVWGRATPGEKIAVTFGAQTVRATADRDGRWIVCLDPLEASAAPAQLVVTGKDSKVAINDIVVGEVWVASGQSNMEWSVSVLADDEKQMAAAVNVSPSHLRRLFMRIRGEPPKRVFMRAKIEEACRLMAQTGMNLKEISARCGFNSFSEFYRAFKRLTGQSPSRWRSNKFYRGLGIATSAEGAANSSVDALNRDHSRGNQFTRSSRAV